MAFSFANADVLHLDPEWEEQPCRARKFLLWPALAYRILAPEPRPRTLNLLQRHALHLCRAGVTRPQDVAALLDLHPQLASAVLDELQGRRILDADNRVTQTGDETLRQEQEAPPKMGVAHIFQDPWTGEFMGRLADALPRVEAARRGHNRLLHLGTRGKPVRETALAVLPPPDLPRPAAPTADQIAEEVRRYREDRLGHLLLAGREDDDLADDPLPGQAALVGADPLPVLLTTLVYAPDAGAEAYLWQARDPFGLGPSPPLTAAIRQRMEEHDALRNLINGLRGEAEPADGGEWAALVGRTELEAEARVEDRLGLIVRSEHPKLFDALTKMSFAALKVEKLGRSAPAGELEDAVGKANNALERLFEEVRLIHSTRGCYEGHGLAPEDKNHNAALLAGVARKIGFETGEGRELDGLFRRDLKNIRQAADGRRNAIGPHVVAALLTAHRTPEHPLWEAARFHGDLLRRVMRLADLRNEAAAHAGGAEVDFDQIAGHVETVYAAVHALLLAPQGAGRRRGA